MVTKQNGNAEVPAEHQKEKQMVLQTPDRLYRGKLQICQGWAPPKIRDLLKYLSTEQPDPKIFSLNQESLVLTSFYPTTDLFWGEIKPKRFHGMLWSSFWSENILVLCCLSEHHRVLHILVLSKSQ